jgi:hypothetical protein
VKVRINQAWNDREAVEIDDFEVVTPLTIRSMRRN